MGDPDWSAKDLLAELAAVRGELAAARSRETAKDERIDQLLVQNAELTTQVQALVLRLSKDSSTSSKPPSSDGPGKRPRGVDPRERARGASRAGSPAIRVPLCGRPTIRTSGSRSRHRRFAPAATGR